MAVDGSLAGAVAVVRKVSDGGFGRGQHRRLHLTVHQRGGQPVKLQPVFGRVHRARDIEPERQRLPAGRPGRPAGQRGKGGRQPQPERASPHPGGRLRGAIARPSMMSLISRYSFFVIASRYSAKPLATTRNAPAPCSTSCA